MRRLSDRLRRRGYAWKTLPASSLQLPARGGGLAGSREPEASSWKRKAGGWQLFLRRRLRLVDAHRRGHLRLALVVVAHVHLRPGRNRAFLLRRRVQHERRLGSLAGALG